jgi:hypothetical protein
MKTALRSIILSLLLLTYTAAHAYEVEAGPVMICDTQEQAERFVQHFDGNQQLAINAVNVEEHNPNACGVVDATYVTGPRIGVARSKSHAFEVTPIVVIGMTTPQGYVSIEPTLFFSPVSLKEFAV